MKLEELKIFGEAGPSADLNEDDIISYLEYSNDGNFLACGDSSGRLIIFRYNSENSIEYVAQTLAHKSEFDYLRSELSEPRVNTIKWIQRQDLHHLFLTTNMHESKMWKLRQTAKSEWSPLTSDGPIDQWILPKLTSYQASYEIENIKRFFDVDTEYIVSIETLPDQSSFLMIDVGYVKLWDIERSVPTVTVYAMQSSRTEIASSAVSNKLPYGILIADENGIIRLLDMRQQSANLTPSTQISTKEIIERSHYVTGSQFVGSLKFLDDGFHFASRSFGQLSVWDLRSPSKPEATTEVQYYPGRMGNVVESGCTRDPFKISIFNGNLLSGKYGNEIASWDWKANRIETLTVTGGTDQEFIRRVSTAEVHPTDSTLAIASSATLLFDKIIE